MAYKKSNANGQATMANSEPVVLASDQTAIQTKITDGTNIVGVLKNDGTIASTQNAQIISGTGYSTGTVTLNSGTPATSWYDMLNYAYVSVQIITNTTPASLTFQTSGDGGTTIRTTTLSDSQNLVTSSTTNSVTSTSSATANYHGPRTGRYFRVSSNNGAGTTTLNITFYTIPPTQNIIAASVNANSATGSAIPANAFMVGQSDGTNLRALTSVVGVADGNSGSAVTSMTPFYFNGTNWDRGRSGGVTGMAGVVPQSSPSGGASFLNIAAGQATTTVKSGAGTLYAIVLNSAATATNTTTVYDNTAASGTVIGRPAVTAATVPTTLTFGTSGLAFATGLTIITATANGGDMTVVYK